MANKKNEMNEMAALMAEMKAMREMLAQVQAEKQELAEKLAAKKNAPKDRPPKDYFDLSSLMAGDQGRSLLAYELLRRLGDAEPEPSRHAHAMVCMAVAACMESEKAEQAVSRINARGQSSVASRWIRVCDTNKLAEKLRFFGLTKEQALSFQYALESWSPAKEETTFSRDKCKLLRADWAEKVSTLSPEKIAEYEKNCPALFGETKGETKGETATAETPAETPAESEGEVRQ